MIEALFNYTFLQNALIAGLLIGLLAPLIGTFVIVKKLSFIADTLSHVSLAGIALGLLLQSNAVVTFPPVYMGTIFAVLGSILLELLRTQFMAYKEVVMPVILSLGVALSVIFVSAGNGFNAEILGYLFGSINTVSTEDVKLLALITILIVSLVILNYRTLLAISFNEQNAKLIGINVRRFSFIFIIILSIVISLSIKIMGTLLISSLMIIPVTSSMKVAKSFKQTLILSIVFSELAVVLGLVGSYYFNIPSGAMIVLFNVIILFSVLIYNYIEGVIKK
ncbi:MAG TPA: metal ABC transporter permease [Firmicutes bacterium]|nr:metal ABC transporter permease [Bacillota bacterium]